MSPHDDGATALAPQPCRVAIYGCGKMAEAMVARWLEVGALQPAEVCAVVRRPERADALEARYGVQTSLDAAALVGADLVVLGVKPQQLEAVAASLRPQVREPQLWISLLAGTPLARLQAEIPARWQRWMPNTPCRLGLGATAVCGDDPREPLRDRHAALLAALGVHHALGEHQFDAFTAVAGSGPAYVFAFVEALAAAGQAQGLDATEAEQLARTVVVGAAGLLARDMRPASAQRTDVTSKGGTTEAALRTLAERGWSEAMTTAIAAGIDRAKELAASPAPILRS